MDLSNLLTFLMIGGAAGWMAGKVMKGGGFGHLVNIIIGIAGGIVGGSIFRLLELSVGVLVSSMLAATVGAIVLLYIVGLLWSSKDFVIRTK